MPCVNRLITKLIILGTFQIDCVKGRRGFHAGDFGDKGIPVQIDHMPVTDLQIRLIVNGIARFHQIITR